MKNLVLLVVDVQTAMVSNHPYDEEKVLSNIQELISLCRKTGTEVVYIRHDGGDGDELEYGSVGWQIYKTITPLDEEKIFDKKFNSAFKETLLKEYLVSRGTDKIILTGLQTEYCIDTTCKVAFEYGFKIMIPEDSTSTYDNQYMSGKETSEYYTKNIWNGLFAEMISMEELRAVLD